MFSYNAVKQVIDRWDPIGLLAAHCPMDEYEREALKIYEYMTGCEQLDDVTLTSVLYEVFENAFGADVFEKSFAECRVVAGVLLQQNSIL